MPNVLNYAENFSPELLQMFIDGSYIAPFINSNVDWLDAKTFRFTSMQVGGYKQHNIAGGWNRQFINQEDHPFTVEQDRNVEFFVDKREVDETNRLASAQNISRVFEDTQAIPEKDAYFFSKVASEAEAKGLKTSTALAEYTQTTVVQKTTEFIGKNRRFRNKGLVVYVRPEIMDSLALSTNFTRNIDVTSIVVGGKAIQTRITSIDGVPIVEVIDVDRFYSAYDFTDGYVPATGAHPINMLAATPLTTKFVPKISSIYMFAPGEHLGGDGWIYQNRAHYDAFVFPNGKNGQVDSIYVDLDTEEVV